MDFKFGKILYFIVGFLQKPHFDSSLHPEPHRGDVDDLHDGGRSQVAIEYCRHDLWFLPASGRACAVLELWCPITIDNEYMKVLNIKKHQYLVHGIGDSRISSL